ncbi:MAG: DUF501 domain-containing protein [Coriobacteriaceae bacterium]|nr:DUF501 domain-containing protein [Coriobacteriaceae bacterium]
MAEGTADAALVAAQIGREPRGSWRVAERCSFGRPTVIATASELGDGAPFPTLFWLTCPWLAGFAGDLESAGAVEEWARRLEHDAELAARLHEADATYRELRAAESGGSDACADVGIAGQGRPQGTKCLHAHAAAALAGVADPVGLGVLDVVPRECPDDRCAALVDEVGA